MIFVTIATQYEILSMAYYTVGQRLAILKRYASVPMMPASIRTNRSQNIIGMLICIRLTVGNVLLWLRKRAG